MQSLLFCAHDSILGGLIIVNGGKEELIATIRQKLLGAEGIEVDAQVENRLVRLVADHNDWEPGRYTLGEIFNTSNPWVLITSDRPLQMAGFWNAVD